MIFYSKRLWTLVLLCDGGIIGVCKSHSLSAALCRWETTIQLLTFPFRIFAIGVWWISLYDMFNHIFQSTVIYVWLSWRRWVRVNVFLKYVFFLNFFAETLQSEFYNRSEILARLVHISCVHTLGSTHRKWIYLAVSFHPFELHRRFCIAPHWHGRDHAYDSSHITTLDTPNLITLRRFCNCPFCGFHTRSQCFDFGFALGLVSLLPFNTSLDITAQRTTFWMRQYTCSIKAVQRRFLCLVLQGDTWIFCFHFNWVFPSPLFPAIVELYSQRLACLGGSFGPTGIPAVLKAIPIGICMHFAVGRAHSGG